MARFIDLYTQTIEKCRARLEGPEQGEPLSLAESKELFAAYQKLHRRMMRIARISDRYQAEVKQLVLELQDALASVKTLKGFIPVCASCKKIRNDKGYWKQLEQYMSEHSEVSFSHGLCPDCATNYRSMHNLNPPGQELAPPPTLEEADLDDPVVVMYLPVLNNPHYSSSPLYGEFHALFRQYVRLNRRLKRIARISDSYQAQLKNTPEEQQPEN